MGAVERLLATARAELGYLEKASNAQLYDKEANAGHKNWTKYAADLDALGTIYNGRKNGYAWCDVFVDWCFITTFGPEAGMAMLCQPPRSGGAGCTASARYFREQQRLVTRDPQPGDQIFFTQNGGATMNHTGIVERVEGGMVYTIEGNTSGAAGVVANGGAVRAKSYPIQSPSIGGYGRPDWALAGEEEEMRYQKLEEIAAGAPWALATVEKLIEQGILRGSGALDERGYPTDIDLSEDMLRLLVVNDRAGCYGA